MAFNFNKVLIKAPKRSRIDLSKTAYVGMRIGTATPTYNTFIVPSDEISASMEQVCRLAPMPVPTFTELKARHDFFFVPLRLLYSDCVYQKLFSYNGASRASIYSVDFVPSLEYEGDLSGDKESVLPIPGSIWDYLGYPCVSDNNINPVTDTGLLSAYLAYIASPGSANFNALATILQDDAFWVTGFHMNLEPIFAYHFIWRDWYRFTGIDDDSVKDYETTFLQNGVLDVYVNDIDWTTYHTNTKISSISEFDPYLSYAANGNVTLGDLLLRLRHPYFKPDGFTSARYGSKPTVLIPSGATGDIPHLREASAWQRVIDIFSVSGTRLMDRIRAVFNVTPNGFANDRVEFIARYQAYIKIGEVITTATTTQAVTGDYSGRGVLIDGKYLFKRRFSEYGWLMCISSVMPNIAYNGVSRQLTDISLFDTPIPQLAEVGDQSIRNREVNVLFTGDTNPDFGQPVFGNQFRYYAYKWMPDTIHGCFRSSTMSPWVPTNNQSSDFNVLGWSHAYPEVYNKIFNDTQNEEVFGDRFFFKLSFNVQAVRPLPKYVNYHL